jgi:PAS domain S-box-containing protein
LGGVSAAVYFATKKGTRHELLSHIDAHLSRWKRDKNSFYYQRLNYWLGATSALWEVPLWLRYVFWLTGGIALGLAGLTLVMKKIIAQKTKALQESEKNYRQIFNSTSEAIIIHDGVGGVIRDVNETALEMYGYSSKEELLAANISGLSANITPYTKQEAQEFLNKSVKEGPQLLTWLAKKKSGETFWVEVTLRQSEHGQKGQVLAVVRDISARKQAEAALRESEQRYRSLFDSSPDGLLLTAPDGRIFSANSRLCSMLGRTEASIKEIGRDGIVDISDPRLVRALEERQQTGKFNNVELTCVRHDGGKFSVEVSSTVFRDKEGNLRTSMIVHDLTSRKRIEEKLRASLAEKDILLREVHHRVKNNLAAIIGLFDLQRRAIQDPQEQTVLAELSSRVRAMSLVHEKLYRSDSLAKIDFQEYIQALISHLRTSFGSPGILCEVVAHGVEMPLDLAVPCGMIINELITNALKYAFPKERAGSADSVDHILVALRHELDTFTLSVADNGMGFPSGVDLHTAPTLGLSLVRMLGQHQLGGRYEIDLTGGTRVTLTFSPRNRSKSDE